MDEYSGAVAFDAGHQSRDVARLLTHLLGGVSPPRFVRRHLLALHQEGAGGELRAVAQRHPVVDPGAGAQRAAGTEFDAVGLEPAVLLGVALEDAARVEGAVVTDRDEA